MLALSLLIKDRLDLGSELDEEVNLFLCKVAFVEDLIPKAEKEQHHACLLCLEAIHMHCNYCLQLPESDLN